MLNNMDAVNDLSVISQGHRQWEEGGGLVGLEPPSPPPTSFEVQPI